MNPPGAQISSWRFCRFGVVPGEAESSGIEGSACCFQFTYTYIVDHSHSRCTYILNCSIEDQGTSVRSRAQILHSAAILCTWQAIGGQSLLCIPRCFSTSTPPTTPTPSFFHRLNPSRFAFPSIGSFVAEPFAPGAPSLSSARCPGGLGLQHQEES